MRDVFKYLTSLLFVAVVVQVALAGYGAFVAVDKSDDNGSVSKQAVEHGFNAHAALGHSDRAYVLETGRIVMEGPSKDLAKDPRIKEAYLGE